MSDNPMLNPSAHSFPFPKSSPTISTTSTETASTWTSFSATSGMSTTSDPPSSADSNKILSTGKKVNQFGDGWISATNLSLPNTDLLDPPSGPRRTRSPSLPILPSQGNTPVPLRAQEDEFAHALDRLTLNGNFPSAGQKYQARPYPDAALYDMHEEYESCNAKTHQYRPQISPEPRLMHHSTSVPNLNSIPRRRIIGQVRFPDEVGIDEVFSHHPLSVDGKRLASKSMSVLPGPHRGKNVYIASVLPSTTVNELEQEARQFGEILMARIQKVGGEGQSSDSLWHSAPQRHCAFVLYETPEQATAFIEHLKSCGITCDYAKEDFQTEWKSREDRQSSNLYIQGLPLDLDIKSGALDLLLSPYGVVSSYKCLTDENGFRRGPVLARMEDRLQAEAAIKGLNNKPYPQNGQLLQVRIADSESQKDFKRKASVIGDLDSLSYVRDDIRRISMPVLRSSTAVEAAALERRRQMALQEILALDARLHQIKSDPYTRRPLESPGSVFPMSPFHEEVIPPCPEYFRQHSNSNVSIVPSLTHTARTSSFASSLSGYGGPAATASLWAPGGVVSPSRRMTAIERLSSTAGGLHHARSSPELSLGLDNPAKLLWPDQHA